MALGIPSAQNKPGIHIHGLIRFTTKIFTIENNQENRLQSIKFLEFSTTIVVHQNVFITESRLSHNGRAYLT